MEFKKFDIGWQLNEEFEDIPAGYIFHEFAKLDDNNVLVLYLGKRIIIPKEKGKFKRFAFTEHVGDANSMLYGIIGLLVNEINALSSRISRLEKMHIGGECVDMVIDGGNYEQH